MFLYATGQPTIDTWMFANRYDMPYFRDRCTRSVAVQMSFIQRYDTEGDLSYFLGLKVSDEAIGSMLAAIWDTVSKTRQRDGNGL